MPRKTIIDIECLVGEDSMPTPGEPTSPVICITMWDSYEDDWITLLLGDNLSEEQITFDLTDLTTEVETTVETYPNERALLSRFVSYITKRNTDMIMGWNVEDFDMAYLVERMDELGVNYQQMSASYVSTYKKRDKYWKVNLKGRIIFDLQRAYKQQHITGVRSSALDYIAQDELGYGKTEKTGDIDYLYKNEPMKLMKYNVNDVLMCKDLDDKLGMSDHFIESSRVAACNVEDVHYKSSMFDAFVLSHKGDDVVLPTKESSPGMGGFEGAVVFEPEGGLYDDVYVLDLSKIYPSIIISLNISPETVVTEDYDGEVVEVKVGEDTVRFRQDKKGFIPRRLEEMFEMRYKVEEERQKYEVGSDMYEVLTNRRQSIKDQINSVYGMLGYRKSRFFLPEKPKAELIPQVVTKVGRNLLEWSKERAEELGYDVVYGDTDSIFITGINNIDEAYKLESYLNNTYDNFASQYNIHKHRFEIEFEKIYNKVIIKPKKKKRYSGMKVWADGKWLDEPKLDVTGFELRRSDTCEFTADFQRQMFQKILTGTDEDEIVGWCSGLMDDIKDDEVDLFNLAIPKGLGKALDNYKSEGAHVRGAKYSNQHLGADFTQGDKPRYLYIIGVPDDYPETDVVSLGDGLDLPDSFKVDYDKMIDRAILKKLDTFDESLGWNLRQELELEMKNQTRLGDF